MKDHSSTGCSAERALDFAECASGLVGQLSLQARSLWAKSGDDAGWLSLPQHMVDSACVGAYLWDVWASDSLRRLIARLAKVDDLDDARALVIWSAGVHDIGKATVTFARQIENAPGGEAFVNRIADSGLPLRPNVVERSLKKFPHGLASGILLESWLRGCGVKDRIAASMAAAADAHHGIASDPAERPRPADAVDAYDPAWKVVHAELLDAVAHLTGIESVLPRLSKIQAPLAQLITGFVIMADWIASNPEAFPMVVEPSQRQRVKSGMSKIALSAPWGPSSAGELDREGMDEFFRSVFNWPGGFTARPVQRTLVEALSVEKGPTLSIVEAPTGEGKTEAALAAAQVIASREGSQGVIVAAPTMATANGLFERVVQWADTVTPQSEVTTMYLGHSKNALSEQYRELRIRDVGEDLEEPGEPASGSVVATQWLSGRKKGILSNFVVATVDQVLMMALQARHSMLRHLGLAGKVVVIDEVHAYGAYMNSYLERALQWLARYSVSVILMSATLPREQKTSLAGAYASSLTADPVELKSPAYPLISVVSETGVREHAVETRPTELDASVDIIGDDIAELLERLGDLTVDGGCVLLICNTIKRAQELFEQLLHLHHGKVELHHSAFTASSRAAKEDRLRARLGPRAHLGDGRPDLLFVVATQVAEQSLDIDADLLVTDIAPMDLIIQRIGRLHRHQRPASDRPGPLQNPRVLVRGVLTADPVPEFDQGTTYIYDPKLLLSTLAVLQRGVLDHGFQRPDAIADLVQRTYGAEFEVTPAWREAWDEACADSERAAADARHRSQTFQIPSLRQATNLSSLFARYSDTRENRTEEAGMAQVRDADPTIEVVPIIADEYGYVPVEGEVSGSLTEDAAPEYWTALHLAGSTVRLPARLSKYDSIFDEVITQLEMETPVGWQQHHLLRGQVALRLDSDRQADLAGYSVTYSDELGLEVWAPGVNGEGS